MFHILGFILFIILIILTIGFFILWRIVNTFLGLGKRMGGGTNPDNQNQQRKTYQEAESASQWDSPNGNSKKSSQQSDKKKLFADDEGEYVEFEEIKD